MCHSSELAARLMLDFLVLCSVKYQAKLLDGSIVAKSPEEGLEFHVKDGIHHLSSC